MPTALAGCSTERPDEPPAPTQDSYGKLGSPILLAPNVRDAPDPANYRASKQPRRVWELPSRTSLNTYTPQASTPDQPVRKKKKDLLCILLQESRNPSLAVCAELDRAARQPADPNRRGFCSPVHGPWRGGMTDVWPARCIPTNTTQKSESQNDCRKSGEWNSSRTWPH